MQFAAGILRVWRLQRPGRPFVEMPPFRASGFRTAGANAHISFAGGNTAIRRGLVPTPFSHHFGWWCWKLVCFGAGLLIEKAPARRPRLSNFCFSITGKCRVGTAGSRNAASIMCPTTGFHHQGWTRITGFGAVDWCAGIGVQAGRLFALQIACGSTHAWRLEP